MLAATCCAAVLAAAPGTALAQSAGDDQYADPFGEVDKKKSGSGNSSGGQGGTQGAGSSGSSAPTTTQEQGTQTQTSGSQSPGLPRTGLPAGLLAADGSVLLGAGALLRRRS